MYAARARMALGRMGKMPMPRNGARYGGRLRAAQGYARGSILARPPMYGRSTSGTVTLPSAF